MKNGPYTLVAAPAGYPGKKYRGRYAYEHHVVYWVANGVVPSPGYVIHHLNHDKRDNRLENLSMISGAEHGSEHGSERRNPVVVDCGFCKTEFAIAANVYKSRAKQSVSGRLFCGRSCQARFQHSGVSQLEVNRPVKSGYAGANPAPGAAT